MPSDTSADALRKEVIAVLKTIFDPELPVDIYALGLIYAIQLDPAKGHAHIVMTLTTPSCPVADSLPADVQRAVATLPALSKVTVELTFDPPYDPDKHLSDEAKLALGWL